MRLSRKSENTRYLAQMALSEALQQPGCVYRVRSKVRLEGRIALDMLRESSTEGREQTTQALHKARRGYT